MSIRRPGVEVTQEFVTASPSIIEPTLAAVLVGPCFQIVDAFDSTGSPNASALAGTYRDGQGTVSYDLPGLLTQADITGFESDIRVFYVLGSSATELNGVSDETVIVDDQTGASYTAATRIFEDTDQLFTQVGVEAGDVVRLTYRAEVIDVPVETVLTDTQLRLEAGLLPEDVGSITYDVVRSPAQFIVSTGAQAALQLGLAADYVQFDVRAVKVDTVTPGDYIGSLGDLLSLDIAGSQSFVTATDGAVGGGIFTSAGAGFLTSVGARGTVSNELLYVGAGADDGGAFRDVLNVISDTQLTIETGETAGGSTLTYHVGDDAQASYDAGSGATDATVGTGCVLTVTTGDFTTSIGAAGPAPANTFVELSTGVYVVEAVNSDTSIDIFSTAAASSLTGENPVILLGQATAGDGATGALTDFASLSGDFTNVPTPVTSYSVVRAEVEADAIASVTDADNLVLSTGLAASANSLSFTVPLTVAPLALSFEVATNTITVQLERTAGLSSSTLAEIATAINSNLDPAYNPVVADILTATLSSTGATAITGAEAATYSFDGGSDDEDLVLDANLLGSTTPTANVYVSYKALRLDKSDQATTPSLLSFGTTTEVEADIGPISADNPLALGFFFALANSPNNAVKGIGVSAVTATKPAGTVAAYTSALEFLGSQDVYFLVPLTQDPTVHAVVQTHVASASLPTNKSERIAFINQPVPSFASATNVASGTAGNTTTVVGQSPASFSTSVNLTAAGVQAGDILVVTSLASTSDSPDAVNGTDGPLYGITLTGVSSGDDFVAEFDGTTAGLSTGWNSLVDTDWTIYRAGAAITSAADQALEVQAIGEGFADRRIFHVVPDTVFADVNGTNLGLEGYYAAAALAGKCGEEPPSQGKTNSTIAGFTAAKNSNDRFSVAQLDAIAGGGNLIFIQESQSSPLKVRHQLSTDVSTVQKRELSITMAIDYVAKFMRLALSKQIGRFNITQSFLDALATSIQGLGRFLVASKIVRSFQISSIEQDETNPDTINVTVLLEPLYPSNYIALTLQI